MEHPLKKPHLSVFQNDGGDVSISMLSKDKVVNAWKNGESFVDAVGIYGQVVIIKLREVNLINIWNEEALENLQRAREIEEIEGKMKDIF